MALVVRINQVASNDYGAADIRIDILRDDDMVGNNQPVVLAIEVSEADINVFTPNSKRIVQVNVVGDKRLLLNEQIPLPS
jgi:hypothetical protein